ncbi:sulfotransferase family 2 domain-containing protein [Arenibacterium sp. CAU 1754]
MYVPQSRTDLLWPRWGKRMIFVHTPKCGGSFVNNAFGRRFKRCITLREPSMAGHLTWMEYRDAFAALGQDIGDYSCFSVIRNPWAWHVSWYNYVRKDTGGRSSGMPQEHALFQKMSFSDYLQWLEDPLDTGRGNQYYLKQISDWLIDETGTIRVSDILRQETLRADLEKFRDKHHLLLRIPKRMVNQSTEGDYRRAYSDEDVDRVAKRHARDIEIFGYRFAAE